MPGNFQGVPASVIASWPPPNYVDPQRRTWIVPLAGVLQAIVTFMVGTRLWLRARNRAGPLGLDDALLVPAFLSATMFTAVAILSTVKYGTDRHTWDVPVPIFEHTALMAWLAEFSFLFSTCCTKISILLFYRRLVEGTYSRRWRWATIGGIIFLVIYCAAFLLVLIVSTSVETRAAILADNAISSTADQQMHTGKLTVPCTPRTTIALIRPR